MEDSKSNYLDGFWQWVELLAAGEYERAEASLYWRDASAPPDELKAAITNPLGDSQSWTPVVPNERLVGLINDAAEYVPGWLLAHIPLTTQPDDPKDDEIPLFGQAISFFFREFEDSYVMEFEILHL